MGSCTYCIFCLMCYFILIEKKIKTSLVENGKHFSNGTKTAETLSNFFETAVNKLGISENDAKFNPADIAIQKFYNHPNVKSIRDNTTLSDMFHFESVSLTKNGTFKNIPTC